MVDCQLGSVTQFPLLTAAQTRRASLLPNATRSWRLSARRPSWPRSTLGCCTGSASRLDPAKDPIVRRQGKVEGRDRLDRCGVGRSAEGDGYKPA